LYTAPGVHDVFVFVAADDALVDVPAAVEFVDALALSLPLPLEHPASASAAASSTTVTAFRRLLSIPAPGVLCANGAQGSTGS
jgi:hypothetical protein